MIRPVVFDIDGTLTAEPYVEDKVEDLAANSAMVLVAIALQSERPLVVSTARPDYLFVPTMLWLNKQGIRPDRVYMRPNDKEGVPDPVIKYAHLQQIRETFGEPVVWVDDNPQNVAMLKENSVPVIFVRP